MGSSATPEWSTGRLGRRAQPQIGGTAHIWRPGYLDGAGPPRRHDNRSGGLIRGGQQPGFGAQPKHHVDAVTGAELAQHGRDLMLYRAGRPVQMAGDVLVGAALGDEAEHLLFTADEAERMAPGPGVGAATRLGQLGGDA